MTLLLSDTLIIPCMVVYGFSEPSVLPSAVRCVNSVPRPIPCAMTRAMETNPMAPLNASGFLRENSTPAASMASQTRTLTTVTFVYASHSTAFPSAGGSPVLRNMAWT